MWLAYDTWEFNQAGAAGELPMWRAGLAGVVCGVLLTADAAPRAASLLGGLLGGASGVLAARWRSAGQPARVRWPVVAGVLIGGGAGGLAGVAIIAPLCTVDGGTLTALCILTAGLGGGLLAAGCARTRPTPPAGL